MLYEADQEAEGSFHETIQVGGTHQVEITVGEKKLDKENPFYYIFIAFKVNVMVQLYQICLDNMDSSWAQKVPDLAICRPVFKCYPKLELDMETVDFASNQPKPYFHIVMKVVWFEVTIKDPEDDYYDYEYGLGKL